MGTRAGTPGVPAGIDPRTPVLVGVGEWSERLGEPSYEGLSPVGLAARAVEAALADASPRAGLGRLRQAVDVVADIPQFEVSTPDAVAPLGRSDDVPRSVAARTGLAPRRALTDVAGGQGPQHLVTELCGAIARGDCEVAVAFGAEALSTVRHLLSLPPEGRPDWSEHVDGPYERRTGGLDGLVEFDASGHIDTPGTYALFERARQRRLAAQGVGEDEYVLSMGRLFAPFTQVASANPHAALREVFTAGELVTVTPRNRMVAEPYRKLLVARDLVDQAAAVVLTSVGRAASLGVPRERWVYLHGHCDTVEKPLLARPDLGAYPAAVAAVRTALEVADAGLDDVALLDLYSCFPVAVSAVCDGLGLAADDPRGLTVTGGLPYFGGPGNDYTMHAIAQTARLLRERPGALGMTTANGGVLSKYSVGVWSTTPRPWHPGRSATVQAALDDAGEVRVAPVSPVAETQDARPPTRADLRRVVTWTVTHPRGSDPQALLVLDGEDGRRLARTTDPALVEEVRSCT